MRYSDSGVEVLGAMSLTGCKLIALSGADLLSSRDAAPRTHCSKAQSNVDVYVVALCYDKIGTDVVQVEIM